MKLLNAFAVLPLSDWLALAWMLFAWVGYAMFAHRRAATKGSLLATTNRHRRMWMLQTTGRENRVIDGVVVQNLSSSPSFFASTTILIIGALLALLGTTDRAVELHQNCRSRGADQHRGLRDQDAGAGPASTATRSSASPGRCASTHSSHC
jgi:uncharacterized membrane protein